MQALAVDEKRSLATNERLRERYRPKRVRILFVGEAPPASGRFFYQGDSGLYRATRDAFVKALPKLKDKDFLEAFCNLGCYLVDLCGNPVDKLPGRQRAKVCKTGEARLTTRIKELQPEAVVTLLKSIENNLSRAIKEAKWHGEHIVLPYPGRWKWHREEFERKLKPLLRKKFGGEKRKPSTTRGET